MKKSEKHLSLRIDEELLRRFDYVARYDDRSRNGLMLSRIKKCIVEFEKEHDRIELPEEKED